MSNRIKSLFIYVIFILIIGIFQTSALHSEINSSLSDSTSEQNIDIQKISSRQRANNPLHMLLVFTKFMGEAPGDSLAPVWAERIFDNSPGSVSHYWDTISFGQINVTGEYLPKRYELPHESVYYEQKLDEYIEDLLVLLDNDPSVDFSQFDNDGPDGIPASNDDDRYVDYIVMMPMSRPYNFIRGGVTGTATLEGISTYLTQDKNAAQEFIKLDKYSGCIVTAANMNFTIGLLCHEYCHSFNIVDLYDTYSFNNETESAGIGNWGLMGHGNLGWNYDGIPVPPCAYTRMVLGCIGLNNSNLVDIYGLHRGLRISDVGLEDGKVYRIWISEKEYFLLEYRRNDGIYYDSHIPKSGLLIWHVLENKFSQDDLKKKVDLECPDGRFTDAGYPIGIVEDPIFGSDNLDFWAYDEEYATQYAGNLGDSTDVFDGIIYTRFGSDTNPNSNSKLTCEPSGTEIFNIHPEGKEIVFDLDIPPFKDWISKSFPFIGMGSQRFIGNWQTRYPEKIETASFLINNSSGPNPDKLVTVYDDSLTVDDISSLNYFEVQKAIERRILPNNSRVESIKIVRENISFDSFDAAFDDMGISFDDICPDTDPRWIQKISFNTEDETFPETISLSQNYPNPFNSSTTISYTIPADGKVRLEIYDILGKKLVEYDRGIEKAGNHSISIDMGGLSTGIYLYRISGSMVSQTKKFLLIR